MTIALAMFVAAPPASAEITVSDPLIDDLTGGDYRLGLGTNGPYGSCFSVIAQGDPVRQFPEIKIGPDFYTFDPDVNPDGDPAYQNRCTAEMVAAYPDDPSGCTVVGELIPNSLFDNAVCITETGLATNDPVNFNFRVYKTEEDESEGRAYSFTFLSNPGDPETDLSLLEGAQVLPWVEGSAFNVFGTLTRPDQYNACLDLFRPSTFDNDRFTFDPLSGELELLTGGNATVAYYFLTAGLTCRVLDWELFINDSDTAAKAGTIGDFAGGKYLVFDVAGIPEEGATIRLEVSDRVGDASCTPVVGTDVGTVQGRNSTIAGMFVSGTFACNPPDLICSIEKSTNGQDADAEPGPYIPVGSGVAWAYLVTNNNPVQMIDIVVTDNQGVPVSCPKNVLAAGESMTCTADGMATAGQYGNVGTLVGNTSLGPVSCTDPSHYFGSNPAIDIEKYTNGDDADTPTGPTIPVGGAVNWTYVVTNTGNVPLANVAVTDDQGVAVSCPKTELAVGESMTCTANGTAAAGQYANIGQVCGKDPAETEVCDEDPSHYFGEEAGGGQGCTPGYWKQTQHFDSWAGYAPNTLFASVFENAFPGKTLLQVLGTGGGGLDALGRHTVAALLNATNPDVSYYLTSAEVIARFNSVFPGSNAAYETLKNEFASNNELGCPLN